MPARPRTGSLQTHRQAYQRNEAHITHSQGSADSRRRRLYQVWRHRPLSGLHWQLTFLYSVLIIALLIAFGLWLVYADPLPLPRPLPGYALDTILGMIIVLGIIGSIMAFFLTSLVLRPLREMTDAAQAIVFGDLEQRERLEPFLDGDDEVSKLAVSLNTLTNQIELAQRRQQGVEERSRRLFSDASHQLRTPLTSLRGFTEVLMRGAKDDPELSQRVLELMRHEAERMTLLLNDLLTLAYLDAGPSVETEYIDLGNFLNQELEQLKLLVDDGRSLTLEIVAQEPPGVQANADRLRQVLHALVENAVKYGRPAPDGWIRIRLDKENSYALVQIIDNGKGIHPDDLPHIFERFYRGRHIPTYNGHQNAKSLPAGTGLGLSIALAIVQAHHGEITVESIPDARTVFTVKLPCFNQ